jgi:hypothetical protein
MTARIPEKGCGIFAIAIPFVGSTLTVQPFRMRAVVVCGEAFEFTIGEFKHSDPYILLADGTRILTQTTYLSR